MQKFALLTAAISGMFVVILGAFGAHALQEFLERVNRLSTFETALKYQMFHTVALFATGLLIILKNNKAFTYASLLFLAGIIIFSGSLFTLCFTGIKWLGAITPIGGLCFIAAWAALFLGVLSWDKIR